MFSFPQKMKKVFADEKMQEAFERDGYIIVDFYNQDQIKELENLYHTLHPVDEKGFYPSTFSRDKKYRKTADEEIRRIGDNWIRRNLVDYQVMCGSFIVKYPGLDSVMGVHQDMTLVDETEFTGINIWCPLVDLTGENGVLKVIPGSHRIIPTYRGSTVPGLYDDVQQTILPYGQPVYLKAGQAIIFDQSIIHFSPPNLSEEIRITTNIYFTHKDARFRTCYWNKDFGNKIEIFEQSDTFMTDFDQFGENIFDRPKIGKSLGLFDYGFPKLNEEWLEKLYGTAPNPNEGKELFKDKQQQEIFDKQGYIQVPFLKPDEVEKLLKIFNELHPNKSLQGFQSSSYSSDFDYKKECSERITEIFKPHFEEIFKNYRAFGSAFLFKKPDPYSELPVHQDWTIVDEEQFQALNIWVPLCDTDENNGTLSVLPGSQYGIVKPIRCPTVPMFFEGNEGLMVEYSIPLKVKAGNAVILNQSLVHYSAPNQSDKIRVAITSGVMSAKPKMNFHYRTPEMNDKVEVIEMDDSFLISFQNFFETIYQRPSMGRSIGFKNYKPEVYSREELIALIKKMYEKAGATDPKKEEPAKATSAEPTKKASFLTRILKAIRA